MLYLIEVDDNPQPWENWSYPYEVVECGSEEEITHYVKDLRREHPTWLIMETLITKQEIRKLE